MRALEEKILTGCGIWLAVLPFTGFPQTWKDGLTILTGVIIIYLAAILWRKPRSQPVPHAGPLAHEETTH